MSMTTRPASMDSEAICRVRVKIAPDSLVSPTDLGEEDISKETRILWAKGIINKFEACPKTDDNVRPWDFLCGLDGSIESVTAPFAEGSQDKAYPVRFRIPSQNLDGLDQGEKTMRAESNDEIQQRYIEGNFPDDLSSLPLSLVMLGLWSLEFSEEVQKMTKAQASGATVARAFRATGNYIKEHPVVFSFQVVGGLAFAASIAAVPILGAVGFAATGPVAGSAAAAWQASIGLVEAGSLFAWCQSAAMGGAALGGIFALGAAGAGVAGLATVPVTPGLKEKFDSLYRRGDIQLRM